MSVGDKILIETVLNVGRENTDQDVVVEEAVLADLTANQILESVASCVNVIVAAAASVPTDGLARPSSAPPPPPFSSVIPPASMSARFNMGTKCAQYCLELGYPDKNLGYQAFLYSNDEKELRNVFMFLVDKLPKETQVPDFKEVDFKDEVKHQVASQISNQLESEWRAPPVTQNVDVKRVECDEFCSCELCLDDDEVGDVMSILPSETWASYMAAGSSGSRKIQMNKSTPTAAGLNPNVGNVNQELIDNQPQKTYDIDDSPIEKVDQLPVNQNGLIESRSESNCDINDSADGQQQQGYAKAEQVEIDALNEERIALEKEIEELKAAYRTTRDKNGEVKSAIEEGQALITEMSADLEKETQASEKRDKLLSLLPECDENQAKMAAIVKKNKDKLADLRSQWQQHQQQLEEEHDQLCAQIAAMEETSSRQLSRREVLTNQMGEFSEQIRVKEAMEAKCVKELKKASKSYVPRSSYTMQIMDILKNVTRQRSETSKVIEDIKRTQNDINLLEGKLYRTYVDVDAKVFNLARQDGQLVPTYRILASIHKNIEEIIECIRQTGQTKRSARTANDQADVERAKNVGLNIKQLSRDLKQVKAENKQLRDKIAAAAATTEAETPN